jgi:hypothetical protein
VVGILGHEVTYKPIIHDAINLDDDECDAVFVDFPDFAFRVPVEEVKQVWRSVHTGKSVHFVEETP